MRIRISDNPIAKLQSPRVFRYSLILMLLLLAGAAAVAVSLTQAQSANGVYDTDDNQLIEISNLNQLNAVRYDSNGDGSPEGHYQDAVSSYAAAFPTPEGEVVCRRECRGYELTRSLDFEDRESYASGLQPVSWVGGSGWLPIGNYSNTDNSRVTFNAIFDGNGYTISNLYISRHIYVGLFGNLGERAHISRLWLRNVEVQGADFVGALAGRNNGTITLSYATGNVTGTNAREDWGYEGVGGLVGQGLNRSRITHSYATANVRGITGNMGGLVGRNRGTITASFATGDVTATGRAGTGGLTAWNDGGTITNSYATGDVTGTGWVGGLVGTNAWANSTGTITNSYATGNVSGSTNGLVGGLVGNNSRGSRSGGILSSYWNSDVESTGIGDGEISEASGRTTAELQAPTNSSGIYADWSSRNWDFGNNSQYPALRADMDGDGEATAAEFGGQGRTPPTPPPTVGPTTGPQPTPPALGEGYISLSSGTGHVCVLRYDGGIDCGGSNSHGQANPPTSGNYFSVDNGDTYSCALRDDGALVCWGSISGTFTTSNPPPIIALPTEPAPAPTPTPGPGPTLPPPTAGPGPTQAPGGDSCLETLSANGSVIGEWGGSGSCQSEDPNRGYARYYSFTLASASEVTITLERASGEADTYLYLRQGNARSGEPRDENDDHENNTSRSQIRTTLGAGTYTIEATTYGPGETGLFTLSISGL